MAPFKPMLRDRFHLAESWVKRINLWILLILFVILTLTLSSLVKHGAPSSVVHDVALVIGIIGLLTRAEMNARSISKTRHDIKEEMNGVAATSNASAATMEKASEEMREMTDEVKRATNGNLSQHLREVRAELEECLRENPLAYVRVEQLEPFLKFYAHEICKEFAFKKNHPTGEDSDPNPG